MAHIFLLNLPAHGHINPTLPLVRELTARGHRVSYFAGEEFRASIEAAGAAYRGYAPALPSMQPPANIFATTQMLAELEERLLPGLLSAAAAERPELIIHDSLAPWGKSLAALTGVPAICSTTTFALSGRAAFAAPGFLLHIAGELAAGLGGIVGHHAALGRLRRRYGLPPRSPLDTLRSSQPLTIVYTARALQPAAESLSLGWQFVGPSLPAAPPAEALPVEPEPGKPLIYISLGTLFNSDVDFYRRCFAALGDLDATVLLSAGRRTDIAALGAPPANFTIRPFVPQLAVLRRADLFITHGGMNSVQEGLAYGVPLIVVPQAADQGLVAAQVARLGAGLTLDGRRLTADRLRAAVERVLGDRSYRECAGALGADLRAAGGAPRAADLVEEYLRGLDATRANRATAAMATAD